MDHSEFKSLQFVDVAARASYESAYESTPAWEPAPPPGRPNHRARLWLGLRDEMTASGAKTVADLPAERIAAFYHSIESGDGSASSVFKRLFGGASTEQGRRGRRGR
jgi:hypothetical protein